MSRFDNVKGYTVSVIPMTDRISTAIRLPKELHDRLQRESEERELSINVLVTRAVEQYLASLIPVADALRTR